MDWPIEATCSPFVLVCSRFSRSNPFPSDVNVWMRLFFCGSLPSARTLTKARYFYICLTVGAPSLSQDELRLCNCFCKLVWPHNGQHCVMGTNISLYLNPYKLSSIFPLLLRNKYLYVRSYLITEETFRFVMLLQFFFWFSFFLSTDFLKRRYSVMLISMS